MKRIIILGSSAGCVPLIEGFGPNTGDRSVMLFAFDGFYPYRRDLFASFIAKSIEPEEVFCQPKNFYKNQNVEVILEKKITRINVKRKKIFTEDKEQFDYDVLIVADTPENRFPDIKGTGKMGVLGLKKLGDMNYIVNTVPLIDTAAVQSDSFSGLQAAGAIASREKEVIFISSRNGFLDRHFGDDVLSWLTGEFDQAGLRIVRNETITEILGEKDAKAVRLKSGKVLSSQLILFGETCEDLRLFPDIEQQDGKMNVDRYYQTNAQDVFAIDQVGAGGPASPWPEPITPNEVLQQQAEAVVAAINGNETTGQYGLLRQDLKLNNMTLIILGQIGQRQGVDYLRHFDPDTGRYEGLYTENDNLIGAVLVNAEDKAAEYGKMIAEKGQIQPQPETHEPPAQRVEDEPAEPADVKGISTEVIDK